MVSKKTKKQAPARRTAVATPTRAFFAQMLSKDISLRAAIFDLLDNSLDGARRLRGPDGELSGLWVHISISDDAFVISDNCGGIRPRVAERYAFRFGRTAEAQEELDFNHATGQFGVGMKRAIFKLGTGFQVQSASDEGAFSMNENVNDWLAQSDDEQWSFALDVSSDEPQPEDERGTAITISPLHDTVAEDFGLADFRSSLRTELAERYVVPLAQGLEVRLNGRVISGRTPKILTSSALAPTVRTLRIDATGKDVEDDEEPAITLRLLCGVAKIAAPDAGWSVALNSRMVLLGNQTNVVGWGTSNGTRIPAFHNQYGRLRGLVLLDSEQTTMLPWNTTKTRLDVDQAVYRRVRREMVLAMEPVIKFLNDVKREVDSAKKADKEPESQPLHVLLAKATEAPAIETLSDGAEHLFAPPKGKRDVVSSLTTSIQYKVEKDRVRQAKRELGVKANWEVGEATFDFWWDATFE